MSTPSDQPAHETESDLPVSRTPDYDFSEMTIAAATAAAAAQAALSSTTPAAPASGKTAHPVLVRVGLAIATLITLIGGGSGIAAVAGLFDDPPPSSVTCTNYWNEVRELGDAGFKGFELQQDDALEERCGSPEDVDRGWP